MSRLPAGFESLESWVDTWSLATETERYTRRHASRQEDMVAFRDAMLPALDGAVEYLNRFPLDSMPEDALRLYHLVMSLAEVAPAVELYGQPAAPDSFDPARFHPNETLLLRPKV